MKSSVPSYDPCRGGAWSPRMGNKSPLKKKKIYEHIRKYLPLPPKGRFLPWLGYLNTVELNF